jgi:hypothetical protein
VSLAPAAFGFRAHSGWAVMIAVAGPVGAPAVIRRQRVELAERETHGSMQPYHAAAGMNPKDAIAFLERSANSARTMAETAVRATLGELSFERYRCVGSCILLASGRPLPDLTRILGSHPLIHTAEGVFFREALNDACRNCGLPVTCVKERDLVNDASLVLRISAEEIQRRASELGKQLGPPWRQDEKLAAIAAWLVLAG